MRRACRVLALVALGAPGRAIAGDDVTTAVGVRSGAASEAVSAALDATSRRLDRCWTHPAKATIDVGVTDGRVRSVTVVETDDPRADKCVARAVRKLKLPKTLTGEARVELLGLSLDGFGGMIGSAPADVVGLTSDQLKDVIEAKRGAYAACYRRGVLKDSTLSGTVTARIKIAPSGKVTSTSLESSTLVSTSVEKCILKELKKLRFPATDVPSSVVYPFVFGTME
jgi:hypothetical protein